MDSQPSGLPADLITEYREEALALTVSKSIQVCCVTIFFYYCATHFNEEKEYIWSKNWSYGKAMYLLTRYSGAVFLIMVSMTTFNLGWNNPNLSDSGLEYFSLSYELCLYGYLYVGLGPLIILLAEIILQMRIYALYRRSKKVLALLIILPLFSLGVDILQPFGYPYLAVSLICIGEACNTTSFRKRNMGYESTYPCAASSLPMSAIGWLTVSLAELILFVLVLKKSRKVRRDKPIFSASSRNRQPQMLDITAVMARDSTTYFAVIFTLCFIGTCLSFVTEMQTGEPYAIIFIASQLNAYQTVALTIMTLLAPDLLIKLRSEYYGPVGVLTKVTQTAWNVARPGLENDHECDDGVDVQESLLVGHVRRPSEGIAMSCSDYDREA